MAKRKKKDDHVGTWRDAVANVSKMTENEIQSAIEAEKCLPEPRRDVLIRLHRRYSKLRQERELIELVGEDEEG